MKEYNSANIPLAKTLRKNMTPEERRVWYDLLKRLPYTVRRQHNIESFIVDFYIAAKKTVIEIDGIQHGARDNLLADRERDATLAKWGIRVLRYSNESIRQNFSAVSADILRKLDIGFCDLKPIE